MTIESQWNTVCWLTRDEIRPTLTTESLSMIDTISDDKRTLNIMITGKSRISFVILAKNRVYLSRISITWKTFRLWETKWLMSF